MHGARRAGPSSTAPALAPLPVKPDRPALLRGVCCPRSTQLSSPHVPKCNPSSQRPAARKGSGRQTKKKPIFRKASESFLGINLRTPHPPRAATRTNAGHSGLPYTGKESAPPRDPNCPSSTGEGQRFPEGCGAPDHGVQGGGVSTGQPVTAWRGTGQPGRTSLQFRTRLGRQGLRPSGAKSLRGVSACPPPGSAAASRVAAAHHPRQLLPPRQLRSAPGPSRVPRRGCGPRSAAGSGGGGGAGEGRGAGSGAGISHRDSRAPPSAGAPRCARRGARGTHLPGHSPRLSQG